MKDIFKNKKFLFGMMLGVLFIVSTSVTYAWFSSQFGGVGEQMIVETGTLSLVYKDGIEIEGINVRPGWSQTKTFTVTNTGTHAVEYNIIFKDLINEIEKNELVVSYTCTSYINYVDENNKGTVSGKCSGITNQVVPLSSARLDTSITEYIGIGVGITHEYTLSLLFREMNTEQNYNQGKDVNTKINILRPLETSRGSLYDVIIADNPIIKNDSTNLFASVADDVSESGLFRTTDLTKTEDINGDGTGEEVLYFRGVVENNYLVFANYCWRIVRTNENGSIKLRYGGVPTITGDVITCPQTGTPIAADIINDHWNDESYAESDLNYSNSVIKDTLDSWYSTNILSKGATVTDRIANTIYCSDLSGKGNLAGGIIEGITYFGPAIRIFDYNASTDTYGPREDAQPTYKCAQKSDAYTLSYSNGGDSGYGNELLTNPIGLLTADEVSFAGGAFMLENTSYYLHTGSPYWTMSPGDIDKGNPEEHIVDAIIVNSDSTMGFRYLSDDTQHTVNVLPTISLYNDTIVDSGTGEYNNPYIIE